MLQDGIIFPMRTGCPGNWLPRELGDDSAIHRTFQRWVELGILVRIWAVLVEECEELGGVDREWQAADCAMGKARWEGAVGRDPTDQGKAGSKRSILLDTGGGPLSLVVAGANVHDSKLLALTLAWLSKCRAILVRYDKKVSNYAGLIELACALLRYRRHWLLKFEIVS